MFFYISTKIYHEDGCIAAHADEWTKTGTNALIVTGRHSAKANGSLDDVVKELEKRKISYSVYDDIEENPSVETIMKARNFGLSKNVDFVIGIGGGSPLDAAKAIALMIANEDKDSAVLYSKDALKKAIPIIAVPTTCGTGSEATPYAILTRHELKTKGSIPHKMFPEYALVDKKYLESAPENVINNTAMDALCHCIESFINSNATDYSRMCAKEGMRVWRRSMPYLRGERAAAPEDYDDLLLASTLGGMAISHTGTSIPHGLSYPLTYCEGVPHGAAAGYFMAGYLNAAPAAMRNEVLELIGLESVDSFKTVYNEMCHPGSYDRAIIENAVSAVMANPIKMKNCPFEITEDIKDIIIK